jgi:excisionase family DNA binding protein
VPKREQELTTGQVAKLLKVSSPTVIAYADAGWLPYRRLPKGHRRYQRTDVEALMARALSPSWGRELVKVKSRTEASEEAAPAPAPPEPTVQSAAVPEFVPVYCDDPEHGVIGEVLPSPEAKAFCPKCNDWFTPEESS